MISLDGIDVHIRVSIDKILIESLGDQESLIGLVGGRLIENIMSDVITSPYDNFNVEVSIDELEELVDSSQRDVASCGVRGSPVLGIGGGVGGRAGTLSAADEIVAVGVGTDFVKKIHVKISNVKSLVCGSEGWSGDWDIGLVSKDFIDEGFKTFVFPGLRAHKEMGTGFFLVEYSTSNRFYDDLSHSGNSLVTEQGFDLDLFDADIKGNRVEHGVEEV